VKDTPFITAMRARVADLDRQIDAHILATAEAYDAAEEATEATVRERESVGKGFDAVAAMHVPRMNRDAARSPTSPLVVMRAPLAAMLDSIEQYPAAIRNCRAIREKLTAARSAQRTIAAIVSDLTAEMSKIEDTLKTELHSSGERQLEARLAGSAPSAEALPSDLTAGLNAKLTEVHATLAAATKRAASADSTVLALDAEMKTATRQMDVQRVDFKKLAYLQHLQDFMVPAAEYALAMSTAGVGLDGQSFEFRPSDEARAAAAQARAAELGD
jgi:hypothetical protein